MTISLTIAESPTGLNLTGVVHLVATAQPTPQKGVQFYVDGLVFGAPIAASPYVTTLDTSSWVPGSTHILKAAARYKTRTDTATLVVSAASLPAPGGGKLLWAPPGWNGGDPTLASSFPGYTPITFADNGSNRTQMDPGGGLPANQDYYVNLGNFKALAPNNYAATIPITGGRNIVIVGGRVTVDDDSGGYWAINPESAGTRFVFSSQTGIVHLEGVDLAAGAYGSDCIGIRNELSRDTTNAALHIQNCRLKAQVPPGYHAESGFNVHPDLIQFQVGGWGEPTFPNGSKWQGRLKLYKVTGQTSFQGIMTNLPRPTEIYLERVNFLSLTDTTGQATLNYLYQEFRQSALAWTLGPDVWGDPGGLAIERRVYPSASDVRDALAQSYYDQVAAQFGGGTGYSTDGVTRGSDAIGAYAAFLNPAVQGIIGKLYEGVPPGGDFCPSSVPGPSYVPPGYV